MISKLKCPVCNHELHQTASEPATYCCLYKDCTSNFKFAGSKELWQALIQAKQDLEIAREALKNISLGNLSSLPDDKTIAAAMCNCAKNALEQIEHKE